MNNIPNKVAIMLTDIWPVKYLEINDMNAVVIFAKTPIITVTSIISNGMAIRLRRKNLFTKSLFNFLLKIKLQEYPCVSANEKTMKRKSTTVLDIIIVVNPLKESNRGPAVSGCIFCNEPNVPTLAANTAFHAQTPKNVKAKNAASDKAI